MPSRLIEIPSDDIFKYDQLGLEPAIASRTEALLARSPQAIAIDGQWGTGKSTFIALWAAYLRGKGVKVVQFNAWKSFEADPLDALTRQILRQVDIPDSKQKRSREHLIAFLKRYGPLVAAQGSKLVSMLQPDIEGVSQAIEAGLGSIPSGTGSESSEIEDPKIESPDEFASLLSSAAETRSGHPVVVMVDELDRCSPDYSVEMLQLLEHVFHAEHVVFVVAMNHSELVHSIRSFYGQGFNAEGYLERFFDDVLPLPSSRRVHYIEATLSPLNISSASVILDLSGLSLREINKSVQHLKSVLEINSRPPYGLIEMWIARTLAPVEYRQFVLGESSDKEVADAVFARGTCSSLRAERKRRFSRTAEELELILIAASCILPLGSVPTYYDLPVTESALYRHHQSNADSLNPEGEVPKSYSEALLASTSENPAREWNFQEIELAARLLARE